MQGFAEWIHTWNALDWVIGLVLLMSAASGFRRGLVRSLVSLVGWLLGLGAATWNASLLAGQLRPWVSSAAIARPLAFVLIVSAVSIAVALVGRLLQNACRAVGLGLLDRMGGLAFGLARGGLLLLVLLIPLQPYLQHSTLVARSVLFPGFLGAAHGVSFVLPRDLADPNAWSNWLDGASSLHRAGPAQENR